MYKVIIADDEVRSRNFIVNILKNRLTDFEIVADFSDGKEIIDYLKSNSVDVVLCDIKMVEVSGIEVAKWIYHNIPKIKVIFFSAYQDFSFAAAAVRYNVIEYLSKPVHIPDLLEIFSNLKTTLDIENQELDIINCYRREIFSNLLNGLYSSAEHINEALSNIHALHLAKCPCGILTIGIDDFKCDETFIGNQLQSIATLSDKVNSFFYVKHTENTIQFIFFMLLNSSSIDAACRELCNNLAMLIDKNASIKVVKNFENIYDLNCNILSTVSVSDTINQIEEEIIVSINSGDFSQLEALLDSLANMYSDYSSDRLKTAYSSLINKINNTLFEDTIKDTELENLKETLKSSSNTPLINSLFKSYLSRIISLRSNDDVYVRNMLKIRNYIVEHCEQSLSLEDIASMAHYTTTWFSKIFKSIIGQTYIDFLITCRINKAKQLLIDTNLKVADIGIAVGYENTRSFTKIFKSRCALSPSEYRRKYSEVDFNEKK